MAWLAVVLAFIILGLAVVLVAFGGSRRSSGGAPRHASAQFTVVALVAFIIATAVALPGLILAFNEDSQAKTVGGVTLTADQQHGRVLFAKSCANCHTLGAANAVGKVGPNLDNLRPPAGLVENAVLTGRARGAGQMPAGLLNGKDLKDVAAFIAATAGR